MKLPIYLDHNATTPVDPRVLEQMLPFFCENYGNPMSGQHAFGWNAKTALEKARDQVAQLLNAEPREIFFTSGATESIHLAILGMIENLEAGHHLITSAVEHKCTLEVFARAQAFGHEITILPVNSLGQVDLVDFEKALRPNTSLVSLIHGNNEIGSLNPIGEIGAICRARGITFHVDAAQSAGKILLDVRRDQIDLLSLSGHKMYAPKGIGALFVRQTNPRVRLSAQLLGGGQEKGLRGGTHNMSGIVGLGAACEVAQLEIQQEFTRVISLRQLLLDRLSGFDQVKLNGHPTDRLPGNLNFSVQGPDPEQLALALRDIAYSSSSACSSANEGISHVLQAIGLKNDPHLSILRFGIGRFNSRDEIEFVASRMIAALKGEVSDKLTPKNPRPHLGC